MADTDPGLHAFLDRYPDIEVFEVILPDMCGGLLHGIENRLVAPEPLACFEGSAFVRDNFGEEFQRVYTILKQQELDEFDRQVTPLEFDACL